MLGHYRIAQRYFFLLLASIGIGSVTLGSANAQTLPASVPDELLVGVRRGVAHSRARTAYLTTGATLIKEIPQIGVHRLRVDPSNIDAIERTLKSRRDFAFVERNRAFRPTRIPNDPLYPLQWHLQQIQGPAAWDLVPSGAGAVIAILDSGVDATHPDLAGKLVPGFNTFDDDTNTADVYGHGTRVAGAAAASGNNGTGLASVAWDSPIMPIRVTDTDGFAYTSTLVEGLVWAADNGASVMNMSFAAVAGSPALRAAAEYAMQQGAVVVASAGNCGCFDPTADTPYLISVGATDRNDELASFSSRGDYVDLAAPGVSIYTTRSGGSYGFASGTSFSSPVVAGVVALMFSLNPDLTPLDVSAVLESTADDLGAAGYDTSFGHGRVNAYQALLAVLGSPPDPPEDLPPTVTILTPEDGEMVSGTVAVDVSAADDIGVSAVELYLDGDAIATDTTAPFSFSWNSTLDSDGAHVLEAVAYDTAGNTGTSPALEVQVDNSDTGTEDHTAPIVVIKSPKDGRKFYRAVRVRVLVKDNVQVERIEVYFDGQLIGSESCDSDSCKVRVVRKTKDAAKGEHSIIALAYDSSGNIGSAAVSVTKRK